MGKAVSAQGTKIEVSTGGETPVYVHIGGIQTFTGFDGAPSDIDSTDLDSEAKESVPGLQDFGAFNFDLKKNLADPGQLMLQTARAAAATLLWRMTLPDGNIGTWAGYVKTTPMTGGVDKILTASYTTKITGVVTWAPPKA